MGEAGSTTAQFNKSYQEHIINVALKAEALLNKVPNEAEVSDEVKSQVREILEPYISEHERI